MRHKIQEIVPDLFYIQQDYEGHWNVWINYEWGGGRDPRTIELFRNSDTVYPRKFLQCGSYTEVRKRFLSFYIKALDIRLADGHTVKYIGTKQKTWGW